MNVSFSYGRALQHSAIRAWGGSDIEAGQKFVLARAKANSEASIGCYVADSQPSSDEKLFVAVFLLMSTDGYEHSEYWYDYTRNDPNARTLLKK